MDSRVILSVSEVSHEFFHPHLSVIDRITFSMRPGEFLSMVGPSGCGKTTLLSVIAGIRKQTGGRISRNFSGDISCIFQAPLLLPWKTIRENALFGLKARGIRQEVGIDNLLKLLELSSFGGFYPHEISRGMQQRVSLARALVLNPPLLLLDEPLSSLDAISRRGIQELMLSVIAEFSQAAILVTHSAEEAIYCSDRILVFSPRPARIIRDISIPFARPRQPEIRTSPEFKIIEEMVYTTIQGSF